MQLLSSTQLDMNALECVSVPPSLNKVNELVGGYSRSGCLLMQKEYM